MSRLDLIPNSPESLIELAKINPFQAAHTRSFIEAAGSEEICQVCGDAPYEDFVQPGIPLRVRLCDDCRGIQAMLWPNDR